MFNLHQDIHSLTDFKRRTAVYMRQMKGRGHPIVLTVKGRAKLVVQDAESYQRLLEAADCFEAISSIQEGIAQSHRGEGVSLGKFDSRMRKKHGLPR